MITGREEVFHFEHALGRGHVFAGDRAAHCGLVHTDGVSDLNHRHRLQLGRAMLEELALTFYDLMSNVGNCLLALVNRFDQEFSASNFVANVILHFAAIPILRHDVFVGVADAQMRDLFSVQHHLVIAIDLFDRHIW